MAGGLGALGGGLLSGLARGIQAKRLKDQFDARQAMAAEREKRLSEQFDQGMKFREDQAAKLEAYRKAQLAGQDEARQALETYHAGQMDLEKKKYELQLRTADLQTMDAWSKILDPKLHKPQRMFMFKQLATSLKIDPKSEQYKDFEKMVGGMDDEALKETSASLMTIFPKANPGQVVAFSNAIVSGQLPMKDAIEQFSKIGEADVMTSIAQGKGIPGDTSEQAGVPTKQVQSSRITSPTPIAQQGMEAPSSIQMQGGQGGTLPIPGMSSGTGDGQPQDAGLTAEQARDRAAQLLKALPNSTAARESAQALMQYARDKTEKVGIAVTVDPKDPNNNIYTTYDKSDPSKALAGLEAPSARNYPTPEEKGREAEAVALSQADVKRLEPFTADAESARNVSGTLQTFKTVMDSGKFVPGSFAGTRETLARLGEFVGLPADWQDKLSKIGITDAGSAELMDSLSADVTSRLAERLGRVSNQQLNFVQQIGPAAWKTPRGNAMFIDLAQKQSQRAIEIQAKIDEYRDTYGTMRPKGKPSVFEEINKIRDKPLVDDKWVEQFKAEAKKGQGVDWRSMLKAAMSNETLKIGDQSYGITGQTTWKDDKGKPVAKQFPLIKLEGGDELPYIGSLNDKNFKAGASAIPPGEPFLFYDPEEKSLVHGHR